MRKSLLLFVFFFTICDLLSTQTNNEISNVKSITEPVMQLDVKTYLQLINIVTVADIKKLSYKLDKGIRDTFKSVEGASGFIDTPRELIMAAYYNPVTITDISSQAKIESELPHDNVKLAECKLGAMWLQVRAENTANINGYRSAIDYILEKHNVTETEITAYYNDAIAQDIAVAAKEEFKTLVGKLPIGISDVMRAALIKPLITYYQDPSTQNWAKFVKSYTAIERKSNEDLRYKPLLTAYNTILKTVGGVDFLGKVIDLELTYYKTDKYIAEYTELSNIVDVR